MKFLRTIGIALLSCSITAGASDLFSDHKPAEYAPGTPLDPEATIGGYPIYRGVDWMLVKVSASESGALGGADAVHLGTVVLAQGEPDGNEFGMMFITANLNAVAKNQYLTGSPCTGAHLVAVDKGGGIDDNCMTIDVESYSPDGKSITYFKVLSNHSASNGRMLVVGILLNAEMLGFLSSSPADWSKEIVNNSPAKKVFITRLRNWAELIQDASQQALGYAKPKGVYDSIPSYKTLLDVPADLADRGFSQQFIGAVEHVRNAPNFRAIAYTRLGVEKVSWAYSAARENQRDADDWALEMCNTRRPQTSEPCTLYELSAPATQ